MKNVSLCLFLALVCLAITTPGFAQEEENIWHSIHYCVTPDDCDTISEDREEGGIENLTILEPEGGPFEYTFVSRANELQTASGLEIGAGSSFSIRPDSYVDYISVSTQVETTKSYTLTQSSFDFSYFWDGDLKLSNPMSPFTDEFDIEFEEEGRLDIGYRLTISARSTPGVFWSTNPELGVWYDTFVEAEGIISIDDEYGVNFIDNGEKTWLDDLTNPIDSQLISIDESDTDTCGTFVSNDIGKSFEVTVSLETWVTGEYFSISCPNSSIFLLSSNFIDTLGMEVTSGAVGVPEPGTTAMLLCLLATGLLIKFRKRG